MVAPASDAVVAGAELAHDGDRALAHDTTRLADRYAAFCATLQARCACAPHAAPRRSAGTPCHLPRRAARAPRSPHAAPHAVHRAVQVQPHAGVLVFVRLRLPELRPLPSPSNARSTTPRSERFGDADLCAPRLCLDRYRRDLSATRVGHASLGTPSAIICSVPTPPTPLPSSITSGRYAQPRDGCRDMRRDTPPRVRGRGYTPRRDLGCTSTASQVNLESCSISPTGAMMLCRLLAAPKCRIHTVALAHQRIGREGAAAIVAAARLNPAITRVQLKLAFISDGGAAEFSSLLADGAHSLTELDLSNNMISYEGSLGRILIESEPGQSRRA